MGGVSASAAAAAVSTAGAKTKRGRSIVHKAAHAHASLRREEEGILSANEGLLQLSAKEASGDSRLGGIREISHAFQPTPPSPHVRTQYLFTISPAGKCHLRNTLKIRPISTPSSFCCKRCCCHCLPHNPRDLNLVSLVTQSTMLCRTWSRLRRPRLRCGGRRAVSGGGRRSARHTRNLGEDNTTQDAQSCFLISRIQSLMADRIMAASSTRPFIPTSTRHCAVPPRRFCRCPLLRLPVRIASQKQLFHLHPKP